MDLDLQACRPAQGNSVKEPIRKSSVGGIIHGIWPPRAPGKL